MSLHFKVLTTLKMNDKVPSFSSLVAELTIREGSLIIPPLGNYQLIISFPEILPQINK